MIQGRGGAGGCERRDTAHGVRPGKSSRSAQQAVWKPSCQARAGSLAAMSPNDRCGTLVAQHRALARACRAAERVACPRSSRLSGHRIALQRAATREVWRPGTRALARPRVFSRRRCPGAHWRRATGSWPAAGGAGFWVRAALGPRTGPCRDVEDAPTKPGRPCTTLGTYRPDHDRLRNAQPRSRSVPVRRLHGPIRARPPA